jgi:hypothetical protein
MKKPASHRPGDGERKTLALRQRELIANASEGDEAFQLMIAIPAAAQHMQGEVDLGPRPHDGRGLSRHPA